MGHGDKVVLIRLVEGDVAVVANAQKLQVGRAALAHLGLQLGGVGLGVAHAAGHKGVCLVDVDMVEQVRVHKIAVALVVRAGQAAVFIQVHRVHGGKIHLAGLVHLGQLLVNGHGRAARCKAKLCVWLRVHQVADHARHHSAGFIIAVCHDHFHGIRSPFL